MKTRRNPFVGPSPLQRKDGIFGRDDEIEKLLNILLAERIAVLHAPSGAGKSSLVDAGLIPAIQAEDFEILPTIRVNQAYLAAEPGTGNRYLHSAMLSLERVYGEQKEGEAEEFKPQMEADAALSYTDRTYEPLAADTFLAFTDLKSYLAERWAPNDSGQPQLLIFDQFEEILTVDEFDRPGKREFFRMVGRALRNRSLYALFIIRDDYLAGLEQYSRYMPSRLANHFGLELLSESGAAQAIQGIAATQDVTVTEKAARRLVNDLRRVTRQKADGETETVLGSYVEPVLLQVSCLKLWNDLEADGKLVDNEIDEADLGGMVDVSGALSAFYADVVLEVATGAQVSERRLRGWISEHLISDQGIRKQVLLEGLNVSGMESRVLLRLRDRYLLRIERRHSARWLELAHDRLVRPVQENNEAWNQQHLSLLQRRALLWQDNNESPRLLLEGEELRQAEAWYDANKDDTSDLDLSFLEACRRRRREQQQAEEQEMMRRRQRQILMWAAGIISIILLVALVTSLSSLNTANEERANAVNAESTAEAARVEAEINLSRAIEQEATAVAARDIAETAQADADLARQDALDQAATAAAEATRANEAEQQALAEATRANEAQAEAERNAAIVAASKLLTSSKAVFDVNPTLSALLAIQAYRLLPTGVDLGSAVAAEILAQIENTLSLPQPLMLGNDDIPLFGSQVDTSQDGRYLLTTTPVNNETLLRIWTANVTVDNRPVWECSIPGDYTAIAMSPDNALLAVLSSDQLQVWSLPLNIISGTVECNDPLPQQFENGQSPIGLNNGGGQAMQWYDADPDLLIVGNGRWLARWQVGQINDSDTTALQQTAGTVTALRLTDFQELATDASANLQVDNLAISTVNPPMAVGSADGLIFAIRIASDTNAKVFGERRWFDVGQGINSISFTDAGQALILFSDGSINRWEPYGQGENLRQLVGSEENTILVATNRSGSRWAMGDNASITIRQGVEEAALVKFQHSHGQLTVLQLIGDGQQLLTAGSDGNIRIWDINELLPQLIRTDDGPVTFARLSQVPQPYVVTVGQSGIPVVWSLENSLQQDRQFETHAQIPESTIWGVATSPLPGSDIVVSSDALGRVLSWTPDSAQPLDQLDLDAADFLGRVSWHPAGDLVAIGDGQGIVHLLGVAEDGELSRLRPIETNSALIVTAKFSPDGTWLVAGTVAGDIFVWSVDQLRNGDYGPHTDRNIRQLDERFGPTIWSIDISSDNRWLVMGTVNETDDTVLIWDFDRLRAGEGAALHAYAEVDSPLALAIGADDAIVYTGDAFGTLYAFAIAPVGQSQRPLNHWAIQELAHDDWISDIVLNRTTDEILTVGYDGRAHTWSLAPTAGFQRVSTYPEEAAILSAAISPDGGHIFLGQEDGRIAVKTIVNPKEVLTAACAEFDQNLSFSDWKQYVDDTGQRAYELTCPDNPLPVGVIADLFADGVVQSWQGSPELAAGCFARAIELDAATVANLLPTDLDYGGAATFMPNDVSGADLFDLLARENLAPEDAYLLFAEIIGHVATGRFHALRSEPEDALNAFETALSLDAPLALSLVGNQYDLADEIETQIALAAIEAEPNELIAEWAPIASLNQFTSGALLPSRGDLYRFEATDTSEQLFVLSGRDESVAYFGLFLQLFDESGESLAVNEAELYPDAVLQFEVEAGQTYFLLASGDTDQLVPYDLLLFSGAEGASPAVVAQAGIAYAALGDDGQATRLFQSASAADFDSVEEMFATGLLLLQSTYFAEADAILTAVLADPEHAQLSTEKLAKAMMTLANRADGGLAQRYLDILAAREDLNSIGAGQLRNLALRLAETGQFANYIGLFDTALTLEIGSYEDLAYFGQLLLANNNVIDGQRYAAQVTSVEALAELSNDSIVSLAANLVANDLLDLAQTFSQAARERSTLSLFQEGQLALVVLELGQSEAFNDAFNDLLQSPAATPLDLSALAITFQDAGYEVQSEELLNRAMAISTLFNWFDLLQAGITLEIAGKVTEANAFYDQILSDPGQTSENLLEAADELSLQGLTDSANRFYEAGAAGVVADGNAYRAFTICYQGLGRVNDDAGQDLCAFANSLAQPIDFGEMIVGFVGPLGGEAWVFEGKAGQLVQITMRSEEMDTYLTLLGPDNGYLTENDDFDGFDSQIELTLPADGTYVILAHGFAESSGTYQLWLDTFEE